MMVTANQLISGIVDYLDHEVITSLPTSGKWILGTGLGVLSAKASGLVNGLRENDIAKSIGIVDEGGEFDLDLLADNMRQSATKYGRMTVTIPLIGSMTFSDRDVDVLRNYIERA